MKWGLIKSLLLSAILSGLAFKPAFAVATDDSDARQIRDEVMGIVSQLIRNIDPAAQINVSIKSDASKPKRSSSPFTLNNPDTLGNKKLFKIKSLLSTFTTNTVIHVCNALQRY